MRIFWRIFLSFWLASVAIMFATAYVVIQKMEGNRVIQEHRQSVTSFAQSMIERHEAGEQVLPRLHRRMMPPPLNNNESHPEPFMPHINKIVDDKGNVIFEHRFRGARNGQRNVTLEIPITSATGAHYTVYTERPGMPAFFKDAITRAYSLQFIFILIASMLVSALLSWSITRPLKMLGSYSRRFATGDNNAAIDPKILQRRDELGVLANDLAYMSEKITATLASQQQLLHDVSHELRAPLARLQASVALTEKYFPSASHTERMHRECERINALIQQILDFSRLNRDTEQRQPCDLVNLTNELLESLRFEFAQREFNFACEINSCTMNIFPNALQAALDNILRNACRYTPPATAIDINIQIATEQVTIHIRDHGSGVPETELEKILQPFYRSGNQMHTDGFGLGLSIAQKAMVKHRGQIKIGNHPEGGLEVLLTLPTQ